MKFYNRADAGIKLGRALQSYKDKNVIVLAIPRGGVEVGMQAAKYLSASLSLLVVRKLPFPDNPESGFGAVAEDGSVYMQEDAEAWLSKTMIKQVLKEQKAEVKRRVKVLRAGKPLPSLKGRTVILVDDGIAMGSTMIAAIKACKNLEAGKIIVASPVTSEEVESMISQLVDDIIILTKPSNFYAVAQVYEQWHDATDEEVLELMKEF